MAIQKDVLENYQKLKDKYLRKPESPEEKRRRVTFRQEIMGYSAIIFALALALTLGISIASLFQKKPAELTRMYRQAGFTQEIGFEKRIELGEYLQSAKNVPDGEETTQNLYERWKNQHVPKQLFECARNLDQARQAAEYGNLREAAELLQAAQKSFESAAKNLGNTEAVKTLENQMINTRQKIVEHAAIYELARAQAIFEVISESDLLDADIGKAPRNKAEQLTELMSLQRYLKQLQGAISTQDQQLKGKFNSLLANIAEYIVKLKATK